MISMICSVGKNRELGKNNGLIWHIPRDMKFFKDTTMGHVVIMGKRTYESLPGILPGREMIVISSNNMDNGNVEIVNNIDEIIDKKFKNVISSKEQINLSIKHKYSDDVKEIVEVLPFNQTVLYIGYRLNDLTYHELNHVLRVYNTILGTMNDSVLFNIVREENSLCYSVGSYFSKHNPSLTVYAGINKDNYEKARDLILNCVDLMKDKKTLMRLFDSAKKTINTFLNSYYDSATSQIDKYYFDQFVVSEDVETIREKINSVTVEEVIDLNNKISLSTIYLLKGDNNDRKDIC